MQHSYLLQLFILISLVYAGAGSTKTLTSKVKGIVKSNPPPSKVDAAAEYQKLIKSIRQPVYRDPITGHESPLNPKFFPDGIQSPFKLNENQVKIVQLEMQAESLQDQLKVAYNEHRRILKSYRGNQFNMDSDLLKDVSNTLIRLSKQDQLKIQNALTKTFDDLAVAKKAAAESAAPK